MCRNLFRKWVSSLRGRRQGAPGSLPASRVLPPQRGSRAGEGSPAMQGRGGVHLQTLVTMSRGRRLGVGGQDPSLLLSRAVGSTELNSKQGWAKTAAHTIAVCP